MDTWMWIVLLVLVVLVVAAVTYVIVTRRRSAQLKKRFGPEYDRAVEGTRDRRDAEAELDDIADRRDRVEVVPLSPDSQRRYAADWEVIQGQFVDEPGPAVAAADDLIVTVMAERGYPVDDFVERADMVSADYPEIVDHYRKANAVRRMGPQATTEELREAFVHYRALFDKMIHDDRSDTDRDASGRTASDTGDRTASDAGNRTTEAEGRSRDGETREQSHGLHRGDRPR
ncbi:hypothetical protein [Phytoactinopolyspora halotolerans]|uniref:hypothetical protein n=1 Tax=Phytoactinopolyspora halotolerans TaxID=1981512 RepID=UPI001C203F80|nr:hypothetical protein [Phytoactinopolyspora halotolerans]